MLLIGLLQKLLTHLLKGDRFSLPQVGERTPSTGGVALQTRDGPDKLLRFGNVQVCTEALDAGDPRPYCGLALQ